MSANAWVKDTQYLFLRPRYTEGGFRFNRELLDVDVLVLTLEHEETVRIEVRKGQESSKTGYVFVALAEVNRYAAKFSYEVSWAINYPEISYSKFAEDIEEFDNTAIAYVEDSQLHTTGRWGPRRIPTDETLFLKREAYYGGYMHAPYILSQLINTGVAPYLREDVGVFYEDLLEDGSTKIWSTSISNRISECRRNFGYLNGVITRLGFKVVCDGKLDRTASNISVIRD